MGNDQSVSSSGSGRTVSASALLPHSSFGSKVIHFFEENFCNKDILLGFILKVIFAYYLARIIIINNLSYKELKCFSYRLNCTKMI